MVRGTKALLLLFALGFPVLALVALAVWSQVFK